MSVLTRDEIFKKDDHKREMVDVPEWGGSVYVKTISGDARDRLESYVKQTRVGVRAMFAALVACDEDGKSIFTEADISTLGQKSAAALDRILEAGMRLNALTEDAVKEMEKNSASGQSVDSGSN